MDVWHVHVDIFARPLFMYTVIWNMQSFDKENSFILSQKFILRLPNQKNGIKRCYCFVYQEIVLIWAFAPFTFPVFFRLIEENIPYSKKYTVAHISIKGKHGHKHYVRRGLWPFHTEMGSAIAGDLSCHWELYILYIHM